MNRTVTAGLLLVASCLIGGSACADISLDASLGFADFVRPGSPMPVTVRIVGDGRNIDAWLSVRVPKWGGDHLEKRAVRLSGTTPLTVRMVVPSLLMGQGGDAQISLESGSSVLASKSVGLTSTTDGSLPAIACLTQDRAGFSELSKPDLGLAAFTAGGGRQGSAGFDGKRNVVLYPNPVNLPEQSVGWNPVQVVVFGDLAPEALSDRQWDALRGWVRSGGVLVVSGSDPTRLRSKLWGDLLPAEVLGAAAVSMSGVQNHYGSAPSATSLNGVSLRAVPGATVTVRNGETQLMAAAPYGNGCVVLTAFDLTTPEVRSWAGLGTLVKDCARYASGPAGLVTILEHDYGQYYTPYGRRPEGSTLSTVLAGSRATRAPGFGLISGYLAAYMLLIVPVNFWLLRRLNRRELAWVTAPVIVMAFTTGAYILGRSMRGGALALRYATVVQGDANRELWESRTMASLFSPARARYDVTLGNADAFLSSGSADFSFGGQALGEEPLEIRREDSGALLKAAKVNMWDVRTFHSQGSADMGGSITCVTTPKQDGFRFEITNWTAHDLTHCAVTNGTQLVRVPDLAKGGKTVVEFGVNSPARNSWQALGTSQSEDDILSGMLRQLDGAGVGGVRGPVRFIGFSNKPAHPVSIANEKPVVEGAVLVAATLHSSPDLGYGSVTPPHPRTRSNRGRR